MGRHCDLSLRPSQDKYLIDMYIHNNRKRINNPANPIRILTLLALIGILMFRVSENQLMRLIPHTSLKRAIVRNVHAQETPEEDLPQPFESPEEENLLYFNTWIVVLIVGVAGMFGGLLYGIKDKKMVIPHQSSKKTLNPGFLTDLLFGLAGGLVIYMIVPGSFNLEAGGFELVKIMAVAIVGGYGGRALVERVLAQQIKDLESKVEILEEQTRWDAIAMALLKQHLDDDPDAPPVSEKELKEAILSASTRTRVIAFDQARQFRKESTTRNRSDLFEKVIPVFEALIEADVDNKYHRNHSQLSYALKGKPSPDWMRAEEEISKAIRIRDEQKVVGFLIYEYIRAVCNINLGANIDTILADLNTAIHGPKTGDWIRTPDDSSLINWIRENEGKLENWIKDNKIQLS